MFCLQHGTRAQLLSCELVVVPSSWFLIGGLYAVLDKLKLFESSELAEFLAEFYAETDLEPI